MLSSRVPKTVSCARGQARDSYWIRAPGGQRWASGDGVALTQCGLSALLPLLDLQRAVPIRQVRDVAIGERLGDDVHHRVRALAAAKSLELFHKIDPRLARQVGRIRGVADPQRSVADGASLGLRAPRRRRRRRGARGGRYEEEQYQPLHFFGASPA